MKAWLSLGAALVAACSAGSANDGSGGGTFTGVTATSSTVAAGTGGAGTGGSIGIGGNMGPYGDFPADPVLDGDSTPSDAAGRFGDPGSGTATGGPCLVEPEIGTLYPKNWLRPRFRWLPGSGQNLFELRLHTTAEKNDLVVYTTGTSWTMPKSMWTGLSNHGSDVPITVTIRGAVFDGTMLTSPPGGIL